MSTRTAPGAIARARAHRNLAHPAGPAVGPWRAMVQLRRGSVLDLVTEVCRKHRPIAYLRVGPEHMYVVSDPDLIREVLVVQSRRFHKGLGLERIKPLLGNGLLTNEDDDHLRQRRLASPAFSRARMPGYAAAMVDEAERHSAAWRAGQRVDLAEEMGGLTLRIAARTLFGAQVDDDVAAVRGALADLMGSFSQRLSPLAPLLLRLPVPSTRRFIAAKERLDALVDRIVREHRASGEDRGDLLSVLLSTREEGDEGEGMSDRQVRDEVLTLLLAGHETTANLLTFCWYFLDAEPAVRERLDDELTGQLDGQLGGRPPSYDDLARLPWTTAVVAETLRLRPPAYTLTRRAVEDVSLGGWQVPAGSLVLASQWAMHRDSRYWAQPQEFRPERWLAPDGSFDEAAPGQPRLAFFPFGAGTRVCIGEQFAWVEAVLVLAALARSWDPRRATQGPVELEPAVTLRPVGGLPALLEPSVSGP